MFRDTMLTGFIVACLASAVQAEDYLCIEEQVTGFAVQNSGWQGTTFKPTRKWMVSTEQGAKKATQFGEEFPSFEGSECSVNAIGMLCQNFLGHLSINTDSLRMSRTYIIGYTSGQDNNDDTPTIAIGTCVKM